MEGSSMIFVFLLFLFLLWYNWRRRWLNFYAWKLPGPISLPIIGTVALAVRFNKDIFKNASKICQSQPPVFRVWIANHLYIVNSEPEDLEILMNTYLEKSPDICSIVNELMKNNLFSAPVNIWRSHRKAINISFNPKLLISFNSIFVKTSQTLTDTLLKWSDTEITDILPFIWKCTFDASVETLTGIEPSKLGEILSLQTVERGEQIVMERVTKFWLINEFVWKFSKLHKELLSLGKHIDKYVKKIVLLKKKEMDKTRDNGNDLKNQIFLERLISLENKKFTQNDILDETAFMLIASSETISLTINTVILVLGLYTKIQEKLYTEVSPLMKDNREEFSKNISKLDYLERVIKETMRLLPSIPLVTRSIEKNITLGSYVFPAGSHLVVPIMHLHKRPDLWPNPLKFDPDRFLPEEVAKRHRCAYIPFGFGPRNCIGFNYGMVFTKIIVAHIVKNFTIKALNYTSLEELDFEYHMLLKPIGYRIMLSKRET